MIIFTKGEKFVKVCLHSSKVVQISLYFDDFFFTKNSKFILCTSIRHKPKYQRLPHNNHRRQSCNLHNYNYHRSIRHPLPLSKRLRYLNIDQNRLPLRTVSDHC